jgi:hypothetical protein
VFIKYVNRSTDRNAIGKVIQNEFNLILIKPTMRKKVIKRREKKSHSVRGSKGKTMRHSTPATSIRCFSFSLNPIPPHLPLFILVTSFFDKNKQLEARNV